MRPVLTLTVLSLLLSGCATADHSIQAANSNVHMIRSLYEAFGRGDIQTVLGGLDPNVVWNEAEGSPYADRNPYHGPQGVAEGVFQRLGTEWTGFSVTPQQFIDGGETIVVLGRYSGTNNKTGMANHAPFAHVWTVKNGKVVEFRQFTDTAQYQRAVGR